MTVVEQVADDLVTTGWPGAPSLEPDSSGRVQTLAVAARSVIHDQNKTIAELGRRLVCAETEREAALATAVREHAENERLHAENRALRQRLKWRLTVRAAVSRLAWSR